MKSVMAVLLAFYIKKIESLAYIHEIRSSNQVELESDSLFSDSESMSNVELQE